MDRLALLIFAALALAPARARAGEVIETPSVRVEFEEGDAPRARDVPACLRYARGQLGRRLGLDLPERVTVRLLRDRRAFLGLSGGKPVELFAGTAYPESASIHVNMKAVDRDPGHGACARTVRHELVHLAVAHSLGRPDFPKWFEEGLACEFASPPRRLKEFRGAPRLETLARFPSGDAEALSRAYAQADSVVRFLMSRRGEPAVKDLLRRVGEGEPFENALRAATGYTTASLDADWRAAHRPQWAWRAIRFVFAPSMVLLWAALIAIAGFFIVRRRRRAQEESFFPE